MNLSGIVDLQAHIHPCVCVCVEREAKTVAVKPNS
jgi:hypothetical protein